ncbi:MAG TPA: hypothetical protein VL689_20000 [Paraburkholderia sp.]|jgi:hypothetical protein|nr:hypothetical protein [Paraburkholderia sp.]
MHAGLVNIGRWLVGAALATAVGVAHAQRWIGPSGGFAQTAVAHGMAGGGPRFGVLRASPGAGLRGYPLRVQEPSRYARPARYEAAPQYAGDASPDETRGFDARYNEGITPVSAETRPMPRPPADSQMRAGSIREDVARYNEERAAFRPYARGNGDTQRPPMPSPYRN